MSDTIKRKYDLGNGVTIEDDGHWLMANVQKGSGSSQSIGVKRQVIPDMTKPFEVLMSRSGAHYYLTKHADVQGFWLSVKTWPSEEAMKSDPQCKPGIYGHAGVTITPNGREPYVREILHFNSWDVKSGETKELPCEDDMVLDYLSLVAGEDKKQVVRFNEVIAPSGKDYDWLVQNLPTWVEPESPPIVKLAPTPSLNVRSCARLGDRVQDRDDRP